MRAPEVSICVCVNPSNMAIASVKKGEVERSLCSRLQHFRSSPSRSDHQPRELAQIVERVDSPHAIDCLERARVVEPAPFRALAKFPLQLFVGHRIGGT